MTLKKIEISQRKIEKNVNKLHPDNPLVIQMQIKYRELEKMRSEYKK